MFQTQSPKFCFPTFFRQVIGLLYENANQKEVGAYELPQIESTDEIYYSARDLSQGKVI